MSNVAVNAEPEFVLHLLLKGLLGWGFATRDERRAIWLRMRKESATVQQDN